MSWEAEVAVLQDQIEALRQRVVPAAAVEPPRVPGVVKFVLSGEFLAKPTVFPRQATLLKVLFLEDHALSTYDLEVLEEWCHGFVPGEYDELFEGRWFEPAPDHEFTEGTTPDVLQRIAELKCRGRRCFKHLNLVGGRRAGKGELASTPPPPRSPSWCGSSRTTTPTRRPPTARPHRQDEDRTVSVPSRR